MDPRIRALFEGPNVAHLATLLADGSPHVVPIWIGVKDDRPVFVKESASVGMKNLHRDPRVAISMVSFENPYEKAHVRGRVVEIGDGRSADELMDALSVVYLGKPHPEPKPEVLMLAVEVERAGFARFDGFEHAPPQSG